MDETLVYFDIVPGKTIERRGEKTVKVRRTGSEKRHITVVLGRTATGDFLPEAYQGDSWQWCDSILCLDSFSAHNSEAVAVKLEGQKVHTVVIPGGCTSVL